MARRMTGTGHRKDSRNRQFERRVPADVVGRLRGQSLVFTFDDDSGGDPITVSASIGDRVRLSLRTDSDALWVRRCAALTAHLEGLYEAARRGPQTLSHRRIVALSGEIYRLLVDRFQEDPGSPTMWAAVKGFNRAAREGRVTEIPQLTPDNAATDQERAGRLGVSLTDGINALAASPEFVPAGLERRFGWLTDWVLAKHGLIVDAESRAKLIAEAERASTEAALALKRNATGDYTPDPQALRFPSVETPHAPAPARGLTFEALFESYLRFPGKLGTRRDRTVVAYRRTFLDEFVGFVKKHARHEDPGRVTSADVVAWRNKLIDDGLEPKTIKDAKLAAIRAVFARAHRDGKLPINPATSVEMRAPPKARERERGFNPEETRAILRAAQAFKRGRHSDGVAAAIRWTPWVGAYTGARIVEITQLRGKDVKLTDKGWVIHFTPEAGATKTNEDRTVPVHSHFLELGFIDFVRSQGAGPLFYQPESAGKVSAKRAVATAGRVSQWVRKEAGVTDPRVAPTHGWRHRFKTEARDAGMAPYAYKYIPGHRLGGMEDVYGDMAGLHREIEKLPRINVDEPIMMPNED